MILSRYTTKNISGNAVSVPDATLFELPEKVLQFGTGILLRGLTDYFIDKANRQGIFNGRIVVVKSTAQGDAAALFEKQDGLYTQCIRGLEGGEVIEENRINASISRVLRAGEEWKEVLECAHNPNLQIIVSNTSEVGIQLVNDDIRKYPPKSYPGKLLAFLYERYKAFAGSTQSGMLIVLTELIPDNGDKLQAIIFELAHLNGLEDEFIDWLEAHNRFCNSLIDRIVTEKPETLSQEELEDALGYSDQLLIVSEAHCFWAIEGDEEVKRVLSFAQADGSILIEPDITLYRELKLRLLNATHTFTCGLAYLVGNETVKQSMDNKGLSAFITGLMKEEIAPAVPYPVSPDVVLQYAGNVLERFRNPFLEHQWLSISQNYSTKMRTRCVPLLLRHYELQNSVPERMALGFAAYLCFTRPVIKKNNGFYGESNGDLYLLKDDASAVFYQRWAQLSTSDLVNDVLRDKDFWEADLSELPGFAEAVEAKLTLLLNGAFEEALTIN